MPAVNLPTPVPPAAPAPAAPIAAAPKRIVAPEIQAWFDAETIEAKRSAVLQYPKLKTIFAEAQNL